MKDARPKNKVQNLNLFFEFLNLRLNGSNFHVFLGRASFTGGFDKDESRPT